VVLASSLRPPVGESPGEVEPRPAVIEAPIDVRRGDVEQPPRAHGLGRAREDAHGEPSRVAAFAVERRAVIVGEGQGGGHGGILSRDGRGCVTVATRSMTGT
jgi:hypothetical protein